MHPGLVAGTLGFSPGSCLLCCFHNAPWLVWQLKFPYCGAQGSQAFVGSDPQNVPGWSLQQSVWTQQVTFRPLIPVKRQHSSFQLFPCRLFVQRGAGVKLDLSQFAPNPYCFPVKIWWIANLKKPSKTHRSFCKQPERKKSLNSSKALLTCPKQNIWHPWKSRPAKGHSCFIPCSSQQNRARASRTWLSRKGEFLKGGVGSFCCLLPLNPQFALRLLWCELCSISWQETRSFAPRLEPRSAAVTPSRQQGHSGFAQTFLTAGSGPQVCRGWLWEISFP